MTEPLVSALMITYNHAPYIAQAIEGVLEQKTNFPIELVIGEDCSTDGTREIVFEYERKHPDIIRVITSDQNVGAHRNSYRTGKACRGKYIAYCDGDDYWHHPCKLQKQANYIETHPECGLVYSSYDVHYVKSNKRIKDFIKYHKWEMPRNPTVTDFVKGEGGMKLGVLPCTAMYRRVLSDQIIESDPLLHQSDYFLRGDTQLMAEITTQSDVHYIAESLATYNLTEESASRSKDITKVVRLQIGDAELGLYLCDKYKLPSHLRDEMEAARWNGLLRLAFHTRDAKLGNEVRRKKRRFTWKEWLLYYGAKNLAFHYPFRLAALFRNSFSKHEMQFK
jgi:glycosyltransferase involved in cell wall biosynthesis